MKPRSPKPEWTTVRAKIKKDNYLELDKYCKSSNITVSSYIRTLIEKEMPTVSSIKKAGINIFRFNPLEDNFSWEIKFDDGSKTEIAENLSESFLENLKTAIEKALASRKEDINKKIGDSVTIPTKINKLKGSGEHVKS